MPASVRWPMLRGAKRCGQRSCRALTDPSLLRKITKGCSATVRASRGVAASNSSAHAVAYQTLRRYGMSDSRGWAVENRDRTGPACRGCPYFHGKAGDLKSVARQHLEIVQLLEVAVPDVTPRLVALPNDAGIGIPRIILGG